MTTPYWTNINFTAIYCIPLYITLLHYTALHCISLIFIALHWNFVLSAVQYALQDCFKPHEKTFSPITPVFQGQMFGNMEIMPDCRNNICFDKNASPRTWTYFTKLPLSDNFPVSKWPNSLQSLDHPWLHDQNVWLTVLRTGSAARATML